VTKSRVADVHWTSGKPAKVSAHLTIYKENQVIRKSVKANPVSSTRKLNKLNILVNRVCGIYTRVAGRLGVHRSFVSRVARGERQSDPIENALVKEYDTVQKISKPKRTA
jgi:hypothetical protein